MTPAICGRVARDRQIAARSSVLREEQLFGCGRRSVGRHERIDLGRRVRTRRRRISRVDLVRAAARRHDHPHAHRHERRSHRQGSLAKHVPCPIGGSERTREAGKIGVQFGRRRAPVDESPSRSAARHARGRVRHRRDHESRAEDRRRHGRSLVRAPLVGARAAVSPGLDVEPYSTASASARRRTTAPQFAPGPRATGRQARRLTPSSPRVDPELRWRVVRLDDNGNTFVVVELPSREDAERRVRELEARGHKQTYWVEEVPSATRTRSDP
jgi:hypothetical protein